MKEVFTHLEQVFGLNRYESKIYFALLERDTASISSLASATKIPRTAVYTPLKSLVHKGFVAVHKNYGKHATYSGVPPKFLPGIFERKRIEFEELMGILGDISPGGEEISIRYFQGGGGVQTAADIFLQKSKTKTWKTFENVAYMERFGGEYTFEQYIKQRVKKNIFAKVILPSKEATPWVRKIVSKKAEYLLDIRTVSPDVYPLDASIAVCGEWVFISVVNKKPFAVLVQNEALGRTIESIHDMVWDRFSI